MCNYTFHLSMKSLQMIKFTSNGIFLKLIHLDLNEIWAKSINELLTIITSLLSLICFSNYIHILNMWHTDRKLYRYYHTLQQTIFFGFVDKSHNTDSLLFWHNFKSYYATIWSNKVGHQLHYHPKLRQHFVK